MLQTATVYVYEKTKEDKTEVRILFDSGSAQSYVTDDLKDKLSLETERKNETLNSNTFGCHTYRKIKCDGVKFNLELDSSEDIAISALTYAVICSPVSPCIHLAEFPHSRCLRLADRRADCQQRIDD